MAAVHELLHPQSLSRAEALERSRRFIETCLPRFRLAYRWLPLEDRGDWLALLAWVCLVNEVATMPRGFERRRALAELTSELDAALGERARSPVGFALSFAIRRLDLPGEFLRRPLLELGRDESLATFGTREALLAHARAIAVPEGRLFLRLAGLTSLRDEVLCDALAIALQLTSWLNDLVGEFERGRLRLPMDELLRARVELDGLFEAREREALSRVVASQVAWTRTFYAKGWEICRSLGPWRGRKLAFFLRWNAASLAAIEAARFDTRGVRTRAGWLRLVACLSSSLASPSAPRLS